MLTDPQPAHLETGPIYRRLRRLLFLLEPERSHALGLAAVRLMDSLPPLRRRVARGCRVDDRRLGQRLLGAEFRNPVGLAAGFDKDGIAIAGLERLGFGFVEVGTVTPRPQAGNPRPRLFRHPESRSLQNALGFNNRGLRQLERRLRRRRPAAAPLGVNVGPNRDTPPVATAEDYRRSAAALGVLCDYLVVNVSSPNTPGLRNLERRGRLERLVGTLGEVTDTPLLVKLSPDLEPARAVGLAESAVAAGAAGIVLTNTTTDYSLLPGVVPVGGLSGRVLGKRSFELLCAVAARLFGRAVLVSVGGVETAEDVYRRLRAGASLVQLYTALVYRGPALPRRLNEGLLRLMDRDGAGSLDEIVGAERGGSVDREAMIDGGKSNMVDSNS